MSLDLKYDYVVLSGGGVRGITLVGALEVLWEHQALNDAHTYIGSSVGALIAAATCIGYKPNETYNIFMDLDMSTMRHIQVWNLVSKYGLDEGKRIIEYVKTRFRAKGVTGKITFAELRKKTGKRLIITGTCINDHDIEYFDDQNNPDMSVIDAIRISMSQPFYFTAPVYKGKCYGDGGLLDNFPLKAIEKYIQPGEHVMGIKLRHSFEKQQDGEKRTVNTINTFENYSLHLLYTLIDDSNRLRREIFDLKQQLNQSDSRIDQIEITTKGISSLQFNLTDQDKNTLYNTGRYDMARWLENKFEEQFSQNSDEITTDVTATTATTATKNGR